MLNIRRRDQSIWLDESWSDPDASWPNIPGLASGLIGLDTSFLPERPVENELEEPRQDGACNFIATTPLVYITHTGLEPLSLGQSERIQSIV